MNAFEGKVVLVTGGTRGVGRAVVDEFTRRGAQVVATYFHRREAAERMREETERAGFRVDLVRGSVGRQQDVDALMATVRERYGRLDVLVNSAALGVFEPTLELAERDWQRCFEVNLHGPRRCALAALPLLAETGGCVVNVSSIGARLTVANYTAVGVAKAGLEGLTRYLAVDFGPYGVRVNSAGAGFLESGTLELFPDREELLRTSVEASALRRLGKEAELAEVVVFLASPQASWMTGQNLLADGGLSLGRALLSGDTRTAPEPQKPPRTTAAVEGEARAVVPSRRSPTPRPDRDTVALVGMGLVVPGAASPAAFWDLLRTDRPVFEEPGDRFPLADFWHPDPRAEDRTYSRVQGYVRDVPLHPAAAEGYDGTDREVRWLRHSIAQALEKVAVDGGPVSCFVGACQDGNQHLEEALVVGQAVRRICAHWPGGDPPVEAVRALLASYYPMDDGRGPEHLPDGIVGAAVRGLLPASSRWAAVDTACSSSLYAMDLGVKSLLAGECELALAGGVFMVTPRLSVLFSRLGGLTHGGDVRPFDDDADGTLFSDGAAVVALKRLADARRDGDTVHALLAGFGGAADGRGTSVYAPNARGQSLAIRRAYEVDATAPDDVGWIVAHGTGTRAGDAVELEALGEVAGAALCTSNKSLVGHTGWPAGTLSVIHAALGLRHRVVPAQRRYARPASSVAAKVVVPLEDTPLPPGRAVGVSAFGFGGTDAHQVLRADPGPSAERFPRSARVSREGAVVLVAWSAVLPGDPSRALVEKRLRAGEVPGERRGFGEPFPLPADAGLRLPPRTLAAVDRTQVMALLAARRFAAEHGPLWEGREESTGVVAAHTGPLVGWGRAALRCYSAALDQLPVVADAHPAGAGLDPGALRAAVTAAVGELREEIPATSENTQPGIMANVVPSRIGNFLGLHGPVLAVDTGPGSALTAAETAGRYLRSGELDLALVLALNGNSTPELAGLLDVPEGSLAEGAFLLALALEPYARDAGWPVLARLGFAPPRPASSPAPDGAQVTHLAADGAIDLINAALRPGNGGAQEVTAPFPAPTVTVAVPEPTTRRYAEFLLATPLPDGPRTRPAAPGTRVVLVDADCAETVTEARRPGDLLVRVRPDDGPEDVVRRALSLGGGTLDDVGHLRVVASWRDGRRWPRPPDRALLTLQEAMLLLTRRCRERIAAGGSVGVALLDPLERPVPHPHTALFTGFVKSLAWELPDSRLAAVVTDRTASEALRTLEAELGHYDGAPVTVCRGGVRYRPRLHDVPHRPPDTRWPLGPAPVVVATGGARGITAVAVEALARATSPRRIWLIGSSSLDDVPDDVLRTADEDLPALRSAHMSRGLRAAPGPVRPTPAALKREFDRLLRARESRLTLDRLRALTGDPARVRYLTCDVTDGAAVAAAGRTILETDGRVDLFVNGSGVHHGGDVDRKELADFRRVRDVKLLAYHHWKAAFAASPPRRWCNFGSVAGLVGLPGETDYAPANAFLTAAAQYESAALGGDEFTVAWTIWAGTGMGAGDLVQALNARTRRLAPLSTEEGAAHFVAEAAARPAAEASVTYLGETERTAFGTQYPGFFTPPPPPPPAHFLGAPLHRDESGATWVLTLDHESYLDGHLVDGKPTLPGTFMAEIAVEAARCLVPGSRPTAVEDLVFSAFVRPGAHRTPYRVTARRDADSVVVRIVSDVTSPAGLLLRTDREHVRAVVPLGARALTGPAPAPWPDGDDRAVADPYYLPGSPVRLAGALRATEDARVRSDGRAVRVRWRPGPLPGPLRRFSLPAVLLDSLARCQALARGQAAVPRALARLETTPLGGNDHDLAARWGRGVELRWEADGGLCTAYDPEGGVLARLTGLELIPQ